MMVCLVCSYYAVVRYSQFFFFQAEDGIRDLTVTGVQTCALPICGQGRVDRAHRARTRAASGRSPARRRLGGARSEERRVGKSVDLGGRRIIKKKKNQVDKPKIIARHCELTQRRMTGRISASQEHD